MTENPVQAAVCAALTPSSRSVEFPTPLSLPKLPTIFRVTTIRSVSLDDRRTEQIATIFNEAVQMTVCWITNHRNPSVRPGTLVSPRWPLRAGFRNGIHVVARLVVLERPEKEANLFRTIPHGWVRDRDLIRRAIALSDLLPTPYRHVFNAVMWNGERFRRFCTGPSSKNGHHNGDHGNLLHSIQTAERVRHECEQFARSHTGLGVLAALLHDAGKAEEYQLGKEGFWVLSDRGRLLGHGVTVIEWIAAALATNRIALSENRRLALFHCLSAVPHAPEWLGIRPPAMFEAVALSVSDRLSGMADLMERCAPAGEGSGQYHRHLGGRTFVIDTAEDERATVHPQRCQ